MIFTNIIVIFILILIDQSVDGAPDEDRIVNLPLFGPPPTPQYSGYLDATGGCDTSVNGEYCKVHYWLALAQGDDWETKPIVLWLNGGPGSSSIVGFVQENGPLLINATGGLMENPYSWNTIANLFIIESPIGVGFSYCAAQKDDGKVCHNTDTYTASATRAALVDFFINKFPEFKDNDFFITGESYAGVYIPTLAYEILQYNVANPSNTINLKGLAVGDPCTDNDSQREAMDSLWYANKYGLVDDAIYNTLRNTCNIQYIPNELMMIHSKDNDNNNNIEKSKNNIITPARLLRNNKEVDDVCNLAIRKYLLSSSHGIAGKWNDRFIDRFSLYAPVTSIVDDAMETYMNRQDVKVALHVQDAPINIWTKHAIQFDYIKEHDACNHFTTGNELSMIDYYRKIIPILERVWIYNGDTDPAVSYEGTRTAIKRIGYNELDGGSYRPWFYNHTATSINVIKSKSILYGSDLLLHNVGIQFGGEIINYINNLTFITIHGSGHLVPQSKPQSALHMITKFVTYNELSPLLPTNNTLSLMGDDEFEDFMNQWTENAKSKPYV